MANHPSAAKRNRQRIKRTATRNLDPHGDGIARGDVCRTGGEGHGEIAHGAVEVRRNVVRRERERLQGHFFSGHCDLSLLAKHVERINAKLVEERIASPPAGWELDRYRGGEWPNAQLPRFYRRK